MAYQKKYPRKQNNVLHGYETFNTIFTLSGVSEEELVNRDYLNTPAHDIIARSGGIGNPNISSTGAPEGGPPGILSQFSREYADSVSVLSRGHDVFFEDVNILSTCGPSVERGLGNFTRMNFKIHEPYSITLIEKIRAATRLNGFLDYQDAPLMLTIEFIGNNEATPGRIPGITNKATGEIVGRLPKKYIPILITRVDFDVNEGGAVYDVTAVAYAEMAYDDRFKFPRTSINVKASNADEWAQEAMAQLDKAYEDEIEQKLRQYPDKIFFEIDGRVIEQAKAYSLDDKSSNLTANASSYQAPRFGFGETGLATPLKIRDAEGYANINTGLPFFFEDAIRGSFGYQDLIENFWPAYFNSTSGYSFAKTKTKADELSQAETIKDLISGPEFAKIIEENSYINWFKIKTTVQTDTTRFDQITKMHPKTVIYRAIPYRVHILKLIAAGINAGDVDWSSQAVKVYNYIYTGENLDIQNLRINYKTAYYLRSIKSADDKTQEEKGRSWAERLVPALFDRVFGPRNEIEPILPIRQYPTTLKGESTLSSTGPADRSQEFYDYLTNPEVDMMRLEMDILGDPDYLAQDTFNTISFFRRFDDDMGAGYNREKGSFNMDNEMPVIYLNYRLPDDIDESKGIMFDPEKPTRDGNLFFSGAYQVVKVESRFNNGEFIQTLTLVRLNNQSGPQAPASLVSASNLDTLDKGIKDAKDKIKKKSIDLGLGRIVDYF